MRSFHAWVAALVQATGGKLVSFDGKSLRLSFAHGWDTSGMAHLVSAFVGANRLVLGQLALHRGAATDEQRRDNEIAVLPKLLELLDLKGATVSIDAIGCQRGIAQRILDQGADYVLQVKDNQKTLHAKVKLRMDEAILETLEAMQGTNPISAMRGDCFEQTDGDHGRVEIRRAWVTDEVHHLRLPEPWPGLASVACVERVRDVDGKDGKVSIERHYYIASLQGCDAGAMAEAVRGHWGIENQLHWHLDVTFHEDACRIRKDHGAEIFSRLRRIALNQLQRETSLPCGIATELLKAGWDPDYLIEVLTA